MGNRGIVVGLLALGWLSSAAVVHAQDTGAAASSATDLTEPSKPPPAPASGAAAPEEPSPYRATAADASATTLLARPGVAFYAENPSGEVERLCLAPCATGVTGEHRIHLGLDGDDPVPAPGRVLLSPGSVVEGEYASRSSTRAAGWIIFGIGLPSGVATIASGMGLASTGGSDERATGTAIIVGGAVTLVVSTIMGLVMGLQGDDAQVHVRPAAH